MSNITKLDLVLKYKQETGHNVSLKFEERIEPHSYHKWLEDKYLENINQEKEVNELFTL